MLQDLTPQQGPGLHPVIRWRFPRLNRVLVTVTERRTGRAIPWVWVGFAARLREEQALISGLRAFEVAGQGCGLCALTEPSPQRP